MNQIPDFGARDTGSMIRFTLEQMGQEQLCYISVESGPAQLRAQSQLSEN